MKNNNEAKISLSERSEYLVLFNSNKHCFIQKRKDTRIKRKCSIHKITANLLLLNQIKNQ